MKLYTAPRTLPITLLRRGDQMALRPDGAPIERDAEYIDHDLHDTVTWTVVDRAEPAPGLMLRIYHAHGWTHVHADRVVIVRETIELDPWTYVERVEQGQVPAPRAA